mmetsp:Transcript_4096/g.8626  ORF Transcript_4096/g.8626 Transcript_4096/m.8626 type:complete len:98 (+) Transcript_4096:271-564(+)
MERRVCATEKDAQINLRNEECASGSEGKHHVAMKDAQALLVRGECAVGMEQRDCAPTEDVQDRLFRKEGCARHMGKDQAEMMQKCCYEKSGIRNSSC